ncbi:MAG: serine acetyltransferase [Bacteroides sp.]|nr:serine acetyltransferase [Bacteroides sp.]
MLPDASSGTLSVPSHRAVHRIVDLCRSMLFPGFFGESSVSRSGVAYHIGVAAEELMSLLTSQIVASLSFCSGCGNHSDNAVLKARDFILQLPEMRRVLTADVEATYAGDPAATSVEEVIFSYPGVRATISYRIAHALTLLDVPVLPRMVSEMAHSETGIDIHPAASIGEGLMIDHGTGVVIGATAIIGRNVKIYQGVTLGARSFVRDAGNNPVKGLPRHPIVGDNVVIYSNTTVLGRITIGEGAVIGGNLWVTESVAPGERLVQAPADNIVRIKKTMTHIWR